MPRLHLISLLLACSSLLPAKSHVAERYDVRVQVLPDATLQVDETVRFHFRGGSFSFVTRELRKAGTDRIFDLHAAMDGQPVPTEFQDHANIIRVVWHFSAPEDSIHEFTLGYQVSGAIRRDPDRDPLVWNAIPGLHDYPILGGRIVVEYPEGSVEAPPQSPQAIASLHESSRSTFTLPELSPDHGASVRVSFRPGFAPRPPRWQTEEAERRERSAAAWKIAGIAGLIAAAIGLVWLIGLHRAIPPNPAIPPVPADAFDSAAVLPPAVAAKLAGTSRGIYSHLGTLFDLARRGIVSIRQREPKRFHGRAYEIEPLDLGRPMLPFESAILKVAFGDAPDPKPREFSSFLNRLSTSAGGLNALVRRHMIALGLLDPERIQLRRGRRIGSVLAILGGLAAIGAGWLLGATAAPAFAALAGIGAAIFVVGVVALFLAETISILTMSGAALAGSSRVLRGHLISVAGQRTAASPADFERWLPFAMAIGAGAAWVKRFRKEGHVPMPAWFAVNDADFDAVAFFDFVASSSASADASSGGGGDAGGSGGGSSSAG
jgi:uncharacterized membrane protein YgcG